MKIKPVMRTVKPKYPDKYEIDLNQALLYYRPKRWLSSPIVGVALTAVVSLGLASCKASDLPTEEPVATINTNRVDRAKLLIELNPSQEAADIVTTPLPVSAQPADGVVVPLFEHGIGTGSIGCMSIAAPVFLSEEEALAIISTELEAVGLSCKPNGDKLEKAVIPQVKPFLVNFEDEAITTQKGELDFDTQIEAGSIPPINIEFVSKEDMENWKKPNEGVWSSVEVFDIKQASRVLHDNNNSAVFYDPVASASFDREFTEEENSLPDEERNALWNQYLDEAASAAKERSREELREQVVDFIEWLRSIDVI